MKTVLLIIVIWYLIGVTINTLSTYKSLQRSSSQTFFSGWVSFIGMVLPAFLLCTMNIIEHSYLGTIMWFLNGTVCLYSAKMTAK